jgi:PadR family transcriptional regulator
VSRNQFLGEFEQLILLAVARCSGDAYGMAIRREMEAQVDAPVSIGSVYAALDRMERKGYVTSMVGAPSPTRGGRAKRFYQLEEPAIEALNRARVRLDRFWDGVDLTSGASG